MTTAPRSAAARDAALAAVAIAALTLPDPQRSRPGTRHLLRLGSAAVAGWAGWRAASSSDVPFVPPAAFGAAAGAAAALALSPVEDATDRWLDTGLRRAGVRHPRPVMAVAAAALGAFAWLTDRPAADEDEEWVPVDELYQERELDPALRALVGAMIGAGDPAAATALRQQLATARAKALGDEFESTVMLSVDEDGPRVVPHTQVWPVRARWSIREHPVELLLQLDRGRLDHVALMPLEEAYADDVDPYEDSPVDDPDNSWPTVAEVSLVRETPDGFSAVAG
ncbi:hypothetical protein GCM10009584_16550 [Ornithinimicrobium humiphilum]|uniref:Uncharacterized protein n=1 Tax=Ornithinimicrobium humiphilum TaxID=125288 RepID=A0A543KKY1_9MICO|nr:hypothetical protein [Ornithinimicrobium humiphilum]TQM95748.1 hypothetical protein FB476_0598 [Ornithinimicrobium humiphilum]